MARRRKGRRKGDNTMLYLGGAAVAAYFFWPKGASAAPNWSPTITTEPLVPGSPLAPVTVPEAAVDFVKTVAQEAAQEVGVPALGPLATTNIAGFGEIERDFLTLFA